MGYTLGIDLGTFNSAAAVALGRDNVLIVDYLGDYTISVTPTDELRVVNIELRVTDKKRLVGTLKRRRTWCDSTVWRNGYWRSSRIRATRQCEAP